MADANKRNVTITKIESANKAGGEPKSLQAEKKLKLAIITNATADFWSYGKAGRKPRLNMTTSKLNSRWVTEQQKSKEKFVIR